MLAAQGLSKWNKHPHIPHGSFTWTLQLDEATLDDLHGEIDDSFLDSYVDLEDAIKAQTALDQSELNEVPTTAEFAKDWTDAGPSSLKTAEVSDSVGFMTPDGLWIPPDTDGEPAYYDDGDGWCEGYGGEQEGERWNSATAFEATTTTSAEEEFEDAKTQ